MELNTSWAVSMVIAGCMNEILMDEACMKVTQNERLASISSKGRAFECISIYTLCHL